MRVLLKESMDNWREDTVVKNVIRLNRDTPSSSDRRLPN